MDLGKWCEEGCNRLHVVLLQSCDGRWTWESGVRKAVIHCMLFSCSAVMAGGLGEVV